MVYVDQVENALLKVCFFGGVLSDVNYEYLLIMLCEIIARIGFEVGWYFWNFKKIFENIFFSKNCIIFGFGGSLLVFTVDLVSLIYFWV